MKKYLLTLLTLFVILAPNVKAEEYNSCFDEYKIANSLKFTMEENYGSRMLVNLPLEQNKTYYLKFWNLDHSHLYKLGSLHFYYDSSDHILAKNTNTYVNVSEFNDNDTIIYSLKKNLDNLSYFHLSFYVFNRNNYYLPNSDVVLTLSDYELTECSKTEPDPEPDTPVADVILDNFYSIYLDKLGMLVDYTSQNNIMLSFIGIILLFVCLEIFLQLFFINGRRRMK